MENSIDPRPPGITAIAVIFLLAATYLLAMGLTLLHIPRHIPADARRSIAVRARTRRPLHVPAHRELRRSHRMGTASAQQLGALDRDPAALIGVVMLVPSVSGAVVYFDFGRLAWGGLGIMVRVAMLWYLFQEPVKNQFSK